jgi:AraC-like DNA-binding protein
MRSTLDSLRDTLKSVDPLQAHLVRARASGAVFAKSVARPPWGLRLPGTIQLTVHAVIQGRMWLWHDDPRSATELTPGQAALVRGGRDHFIAHRPNARCLSPEQFQARHADDEGDLEPATSVFLCGAYVLSGDVGRGLLEALPPVLTLSAAADGSLQSVISLLSSELAGSELGQQTVLDRLLDILLVLAIRASFQQGEHAPRWYQASVDSRLAPALNVMHGDAAHAWTVPELAAISGLSRAAFARAFQLALGQAPMQYLTEWAHDTGARSFACQRVNADGDRHANGVRFALCIRGGLPPPPRTSTRPVETKRNDKSGVGADGRGPSPRHLMSEAPPRPRDKSSSLRTQAVPRETRAAAEARFRSPRSPSCTRRKETCDVALTATCADPNKVPAAGPAPVVL